MGPDGGVSPSQEMGLRKQKSEILGVLFFAI